MLPPIVLSIKGTTKKNAHTSFPRMNFAIGKATKPPMIPVPIISPKAESEILLNFLYIYEASIAPNILPGNASIEPVPSIFLSSDIKNAFNTA